MQRSAPVVDGEKYGQVKNPARLCNVCELSVAEVLTATVVWVQVPTVVVTDRAQSLHALV